MKKILIASRNEGKIKEFQALFAKYQIDVKSLNDLLTPIPIEENGETFQENAKIKAKTVSEQLQIPVLADDSGLVIDALEGEPGIYSARYAGKNATDQQNIDQVMEKMKSIPLKQRTAHFVCVLALSRPNHQTVYCKGTCEGHIALTQRGTYGFGYDPIFIPKDYEKTMAELKPEVKNAISHRKHAMDQLDQWLQKNMKDL